MKRTTSLILITLLISLFGCSMKPTSITEKASSGAALDLSQIKTMGDALKYKDEENYNIQEGFDETRYFFVFEKDGIYYRAIADLPKDISEAIWSMDFEEREKKLPELINPLALSTMENLSAKAPSKEELDKLIGKPGKELFDNDWTYSYYNLEDMEAGLNHGTFSYAVRFNYDGPQMINSDDFDFYKEFADLTIKSVTVSGVGDAMSTIYY